ncbi:hypothetical protein AA101099_0856 [Neoasaia chiangmaiensis NBRC 101099]|uniref:2-oxo-4-hydroxy-4-carboxy-5-ureidoimidazoline decarboxylase n=1 Tax=Neoasaia chiangmaiensis TaxID=320497 RepID=A0A1U9KMH1_9PROT|nr:2-oxo-4-hydroxy-4-carboxy-5-ureidoimidazoline decarboxylase [Neoasaia chiangmaiensis]AQS86975.1 OHCU decarboxylase [Neoasaia chiangmaiensis]GBR37732.1 hypothetical protein AA101099_0856 [Neoasaia chiangmaiensis NBRC 101099]GEN15093.1 OHCU decarboxylase [Neoasaia chiangmaiensis]
MIEGISSADFVSRFGDIYENSPWIVEAAYAQGPFADPAIFLATCADIVRGADIARRRALVRAHPELARKFGVDPTLGELSAAEQAGAGLDRLTPDEFTRFRAANDAYRQRFDMPFVICVREASKAVILAELQRRLANADDVELEEALTQIDRIAALRLQDKLRP